MVDAPSALLLRVARLEAESDITRLAADYCTGSSARAFHWTSNPHIEVTLDGTSARARFDVLSETQLLDSTRIVIAGTYHDTYVAGRNGWKLARRAADVHSERTVRGVE